jgi:hypothetical protein
MKIGDLVKYRGVEDSRAGLIVEFIEKKCWRTHILGKAIDWEKIDPEPHAVVLIGGNMRPVPLTDLEPVDASR